MRMISGIVLTLMFMMSTAQARIFTCDAIMNFNGEKHSVAFMGKFDPNTAEVQEPIVLFIDIVPKYMWTPDKTQLGGDGKVFTVVGKDNNLEFAIAHPEGSNNRTYLTLRTPNQEPTPENSTEADNGSCEFKD